MLSSLDIMICVDVRKKQFDNAEYIILEAKEENNFLQTSSQVESILEFINEQMLLDLDKIEYDYMYRNILFAASQHKENYTYKHGYITNHDMIDSLKKLYAGMFFSCGSMSELLKLENKISKCDKSLVWLCEVYRVITLVWNLIITKGILSKFQADIVKDKVLSYFYIMYKNIFNTVYMDNVEYEDMLDLPVNLKKYRVLSIDYIMSTTIVKYDTLYVKIVDDVLNIIAIQTTSAIKKKNTSYIYHILCENLHNHFYMNYNEWGPTKQTDRYKNGIAKCFKTNQFKISIDSMSAVIKTIFMPLYSNDDIFQFSDGDVHIFFDVLCNDNMQDVVDFFLKSSTREYNKKIITCSALSEKQPGTYTHAMEYKHNNQYKIPYNLYISLNHINTLFSGKKQTSMMYANEKKYVTEIRLMYIINFVCKCI